METIELRPAHEWTCDNCGRINYCSSIVWEGSAEEEEQMKQEFGVESWEEGEFMTSPDKVTCSFCGTEFKTIDYQN
jgi:hypothetical protein